MRKSGFLLLLAAGLSLACNGHGSPTEVAKSAPPTLANLRNPATATLLSTGAGGQRSGQLPISFDFKAPGGDLKQVVVTFPDGTARNPLDGVAGQRAGTAGVLQALVLPAAGQRVAFTVQATDADGNVSNTLSGTYTSP